MPGSSCRGRTSAALVTHEVTEPAGRMVHVQHVQLSGIHVHSPVLVRQVRHLRKPRMAQLRGVRAACLRKCRSSGSAHPYQAQLRDVTMCTAHTAVGSKRAPTQRTGALVPCQPYASPAHSTTLLACQLTVQQILVLEARKRGVPQGGRTRSEMALARPHPARPQRRERHLGEWRMERSRSQLEFLSRGQTTA